jgi:ligand-binding SRPBCC domain-containing protein
VTASAQGIYGDRGDEELTESSSLGSDFLSEVCKAWEKPFHDLASKAQKPRTVILRIGVVLSQRGGALKKLISLFQKNLGASLGTGDQWMSWISLKDLVEVFFQSVTDPQYEGVLNAVQPAPIQNAEFTKCLCQNLNSLQLPSVPAFVLKTILGEMSYLVLASQKVKPAKLIELHFQFTDTDLNLFLNHELKPFQNGQGFIYAEQFIPAEIKKVFQFFSEAQNLEKITPETLSFQIEKMSTPEIQKDTLIDYKMKIHGVPAHWRTLIDVWNPPFQFVDTQLKGPYTLWHHTHTFKKFANGTLMTDEVRFKLPLGLLGRLTAGPFVESDVQNIFQYRRHIIANQKF